MIQVRRTTDDPDLPFCSSCGERSVLMLGVEPPRTAHTARILKAAAESGDVSLMMDDGERIDFCEECARKAINALVHMYASITGKPMTFTTGRPIRKR